MNIIFLGGSVVRLPLQNVICAPAPHDFVKMLALDKKAFGIFMAGTPQVGVELTRMARVAGLANPLYCLMYGPEADHAFIAKVLNAGADQVEKFPVDGNLFRAQISAIANRGHGDPDPILHFGGMSYDKNFMTLSAGGKKVHLTKLETKVLFAIVSAQGKPLSKEELLTHLYGDDDDDAPVLKIIDVVVCKIRRKMMTLSNGLDFIQTIWGGGYRFAADGFKPDFRKTYAGDVRFVAERGPSRRRKETKLREAAE